MLQWLNQDILSKINILETTSGEDCGDNKLPLQHYLSYMAVLKRFSVLLLLMLTAFMMTFARPKSNQGHHTKAKSKEIAQKKPNRQASRDRKAVVSKKATTRLKQKEKAVAASDTKPVKETIDAARIINEISLQQAWAKRNNVTFDPATAKQTIILPSEPSPATDLASQRTVTRVVPKKEETSFTSVMMEWVKDKYSCMIDVLPNQISNVMLYRFIDEWYGVKYRMGGTSKQGIDCSAFVQSLYKYVFGLDLVRTAWSQFQTAEFIKDPADLREGDLVFFKVKSSRISHVGVYLRNNFFVHSASSKGVSIAKLTSDYWSKYFAGGGRVLQ